MHVTMVKKRLADGEPCRKCAQAEELLRRRGLWERIDEVVWADEGEPLSPGMQLAARFGVSLAPFFLVRGDDGNTVVYDSVLRLVTERLAAADVVPAASHANADPPATNADPPATNADPPATHGSAAPPATNGNGASAATHGESAATPAEIEAAGRELAEAHPREILRWGLTRWGASLGIAFSGAEDVALVHMASELGLPFSVFCLDTGRLHPETYRFIDAVRRRYKVEIALMSPEPGPLQAMVREKGLFSFYEDGHEECCGIRKVEPLRRKLKTLRAWATGQRRDQSPATRADIPVIQRDATNTGAEGPIVKLNPLARWTSAQVWQFLREGGVPFNPLHERGFVSIGCEPCTRATLPGEHERAGRWWWEDATKRECGLHVGHVAVPPRPAASRA